MADWIWILIPLMAIGVGGFKEWLKFKAKQERLGDSTHALADTVGDLRSALERSEAQRERLTERVQNLETIVTSQAWDALYDGSSPPRLGASRNGTDLPDEPGEEEKAERLARQLNA